MTITVQQLIEKLQSFPGNAVVALRDADDEPLFITAFEPGVNELKIVISDDSEEEEDEE
ncbi:hypothetical protein H1Q63_36750 [Desmonostoc muscorum CCALA 125]|nr:hypothetical protein [Desmonostoc muscorum CCALA 125]